MSAKHQELHRVGHLHLCSWPVSSHVLPISCRYGAWEAQQLDASFPQLQPPGSGDIEACVSALQTAADAALSACEAALQRCQRLCEGAELPSLALVADDRLAGLLRDFEVCQSACTTLSLSLSVSVHACISCNFASAIITT